MFVGTQQRITFGNVHVYIDMAFYNKILKSYVLIELKTIKLMPEAVGQLDMYLNYYAVEVNDENDNSPIGLILCTILIAQVEAILSSDEKKNMRIISGLVGKIIVSSLIHMSSLEDKKVIHGYL